MNYKVTTTDTKGTTTKEYTKFGLSVFITSVYFINFFSGDFEQAKKISGGIMFELDNSEVGHVVNIDYTRTDKSRFLFFTFKKDNEINLQIERV